MQRLSRVRLALSVETSAEACAGHEPAFNRPLRLSLLSLAEIGLSTLLLIGEPPRHASRSYPSLLPMTFAGLCFSPSSLYHFYCYVPHTSPRTHRAWTFPA